MLSYFDGYFIDFEIIYSISDTVTVSVSLVLVMSILLRLELSRRLAHLFLLVGFEFEALVTCFVLYFETCSESVDARPSLECTLH